MPKEMIRRNRALVLSAAVLATLAGGCADVDSDVLTKEQFVARADELCADLDDRAAAAGSPTTAGEGVQQLRRGGARLEELDRKLMGFRISPELQAAMKPYFSADAQLTDLASRLASAYEDGDDKAVAKLQQQADAATATRQQAADDVGLKVCGRPPQSPPPGRGG